MTLLAIAGTSLVAAIFLYHFYTHRAQPQPSKTTDQAVETSSPTPTGPEIAISIPKPSITDMPPPPLPIPVPSISTTPMAPPRLKPATTSRPPSLNGTLRPPPSAASSLRVPPQKALSNTHMQPASSTLPLPTDGSGKKSKRVTLQPGHSPLDWAALQRSTSREALVRLRGKDAVPTLTRITPSQLKKQNGRHGRDAWTVYQGRVYNITAYLDFHPGGRQELMRGAGRKSDELFAEVHPWVNWEGMLAECCLGLLVAEDLHGDLGNKLDEMD